MPERKRQTVEEFIKELESDPVWRAKHDALEARLGKRAEEFAAEERPLVADLRKAGFNVSSLEDVINTYGAGLPWEHIAPTRPYSELLPILFKHLQRPYSADVRGTIAQAINGVREAEPYWAAIKEMVYKEKDDFARQMLINVLCEIALRNKAFLPEILTMIRDRRLKTNRVLLVRVLTRHAPRSSAAERSLQELKNDPDLRVEIGRRLHERKVRQRRKARRSKANR